MAGNNYLSADGGMPEFTEAMKKYASEICDGQLGSAPFHRQLYL